MLRAPVPRRTRLTAPSPSPHPLPKRSGTWETHAVDNQAGFLDAFGSAFATGAPSVVNAKELHALAHDREAGVLEDTTMLGDTAVVNRTEIGRQREIVAPDGSVMKVTARWDGDVWVEVDEDLVLEVRRWREGDFLVVARTVTRDDGVLVTSKMFMGKPIRKAPVFAALPNVGSGKDSKVSSKKTKKTKKKTNAYVDEDATSETGSEHNSVYSHAQKAVESATAGVFGGLFGSKEGGSPKAGDPTAVSKKTGSKTSAVSARGAAKPKDAAAFFNLRLGTLFCGSFPCSLRNTPGHLYIFEFHVGFGALNLGDAAKWHAGAKTVNNLEIVGPTSLQLGLTTGLTLEFQGVDNRDAVYEALVSMLEKVPPSPGEEVHGEPDAKIAAPLRIGFEQERYVFVYVARCESLPDSANGSVAIATCALGRYGAAVTATGPTLQGAATRFSKTLVRIGPFPNPGALFAGCRRASARCARSGGLTLFFLQKGVSRRGSRPGCGFADPRHRGRRRRGLWVRVLHARTGAHPLGDAPPGPHRRGGGEAEPVRRVAFAAGNGG